MTNNYFQLSWEDRRLVLQQASAHFRDLTKMIYTAGKAIISFSAILRMTSQFSCVRKLPCAPVSLYPQQAATLQANVALSQHIPNALIVLHVLFRNGVFPI